MKVTEPVDEYRLRQFQCASGAVIELRKYNDDSIALAILNAGESRYEIGDANDFLKEFIQIMDALRLKKD